MDLDHAGVASPARSVSWNMFSRRETSGFHIHQQRSDSPQMAHNNGPTHLKWLTTTVRTHSVASALVMRIHEPAAPVNPCPESFRFSRPFRLSGFGLRHEHGHVILAERVLGIPPPRFFLL